jgi:uncharacterized protein
MAEMYHQGHRQVQDQFDTRRLADRMAQRAEERSLSISQADRDFIEARDMFFLATADAEGHPNCSYKGGDPGFVRVLDEHTIAFPNYDGNGMYLSMGNTVVNPHVGLLFIDFEGQRRLRLNGVARIDPSDPLMAEYPEAQFIVRVQISQLFGNCPRYIHKYQLMERSRYVPHAECETPIPDWKRTEWAQALLPATDPARRSAQN